MYDGIVWMAMICYSCLKEKKLFDMWQVKGANRFKEECLISDEENDMMNGEVAKQIFIDTIMKSWVNKNLARNISAFLAMILKLLKAESITWKLIKA